MLDSNEIKVMSRKLGVNLITLGVVLPMLNLGDAFKIHYNPILPIILITCGFFACLFGVHTSNNQRST
jgi:hypothetical protein